MGLRKEYFTPSEFSNSVIAPRSNCILSTNKLQKVFPLMDAKTMIEYAAENYK